MAKGKSCRVCKYEDRENVIVTTEKSNMEWSRLGSFSEASVRRHYQHPQREGQAAESREESSDSDGNRYVKEIRHRPVTLEDAHEWVRASGYNTEDYIIAVSSKAYGKDMFSNGMSARPRVRKPESAAWDIVKPVVAAQIHPINHKPASRNWKTAVLMADTQIGFRRYEDGTLDAFHDDAAISVATQIVQIENPDRTVVMGDIVDLAEQGRFAQEASFANTTQVALQRTHEFAAQLRTATDGVIDFIEGNHDKRLQNFIELNAKAAFGITRAGSVDELPVMSLPFLLRLDELDVNYHDAYPAAHVWINDKLRAEHGTKVNSNGSTAQKYMNETPHISRAFGHTHRLEAVSRTTWDRMGKIRSMAINPGCLCRVDGAVPSVHGAIGASGKPATVFEDWQQGVAVVRYTDEEFFVDLVQIDEGRTVYQGQEVRA